MTASTRTTPRLLRQASWLAAVGGVGVAVAAAVGISWSGLLAGPDPATEPNAATAAPSPPPAAAPVPPPPPPVTWSPAVAAAAGDPADLLAADATQLLQVAATSLLARAPITVLAPFQDPKAVAAASDLARELRAPLLLGPAVDRGGPVIDAGGDTGAVRDRNAEVLGALDVELVVLVGRAARPVPDVRVHRVDAGAVARDLVLERLRTQAEAAAASTGAVRSDVGVALVRAGDRAAGLATATVSAAGVPVVELTADDPRADAPLRAALSTAPEGPAWALGSASAWADVDREQLAWRLAVARRGDELPGGGQLLFPARRFVALYGNPTGPALGVLGEQGPDEAVERARKLAASYAEFSDVPVVPAFEIIATVASAGPGPAGDYSSRTDRAELERWVDVAEAAGVHVVLDLQPGRTDFLTQAREYEDLLARPHVGLALDPEWRLRPGQVHLRQIGSVDVEEVNEVVHWLADLTRREALPQKLLILHQFTLSMIQGRSRLDTSRDELAVVIHADGQGSQPAKLATYEALTTLDPPAGVWWGWKNFHDEDLTLRSPADTLAVDPAPVFVSYQ